MSKKQERYYMNLTRKNQFGIPINEWDVQDYVLELEKMNKDLAHELKRIAEIEKIDLNIILDDYII